MVGVGCSFLIDIVASLACSTHFECFLSLEFDSSWLASFYHFYLVSLLIVITEGILRFISTLSCYTSRTGLFFFVSHYMFSPTIAKKGIIYPSWPADYRIRLNTVRGHRGFVYYKWPHHQNRYYTLESERKPKKRGFKR